MRTFLVFHQNGEVSERLCNCRYFEMNKFINFNNYKTYDRYIILYNDNNNLDYNITDFTFTDDKYRGDIGLVKLDKHGTMIDLKIFDYYDSLFKQKIEPNDLYYSSDEENFDYDFT